MNEQTLFQEALDRPAHERTVFLRAACGDNQQLLRRTEKLLNLHEQSGSFMNLPVGQLEEAIEQVGQDQSGNQIGPYKLLELIGEGGMGSVYMAEQTTPVRRRVALKLIKPGMDSRQVIARFEAERQALSLMDHPNIAKVLDAGTAHQKGVIHRDIKPNNVLVAEHCRSQPAKLPTLMRGELDWIVMKAMEKDRDRRYGTANSLALDIESFLKNEAVQAGPPSTLYRFRKFARRNRVWLLTASVVACAVLLGLVTASWQYLRAKRAERQSLALAQTERELREAESWQRERAQAAEDQATADAARARAMNEFLIHDLLRLASAEGQAGAELTVEPDIRLVTVLNRASERLAARFQDQPVVRAALQRTLASAYQGLGRYEQASALWKQAIVSEPQDNEQGRQRTMADLNNLGQSLNSAGRLEESLEVFEQLLNEKEKQQEQSATLPITLNNLGFGHIQLGQYRQGIAYLERALKSYHADPETPPTMIVYLLNNLSVAHQELGDTQRSLQLVEEAYQLSQQHFCRSHPLALTTLSNLGVLLFNGGDRERGVQLIHQVWERHRDALGDQHPDTMHSLSNLALMLHRVERSEEALPLARQAFELHQSHPDLGPNHPQTLYTQTSLAIILGGLGKSTEAKELGAQALATLEQTLPADHPYLTRAREAMADIQAGGG